MPILVETSVVGTTLVSMATCWIVFALIGPMALRVIFPAYRKLNSDKRIVTNNAFLAMCHGAVVGSWSLYLFSFYSDVKQYDSNLRHTWAALIGYLTIDLLLMLKYPFISKRSFILHHVIAILGTVGVLHMGIYRVSRCLNIVLMMELSSPFSNMRVLLYELGLRKSRAYVINGITLLVTFFLLRILPSPIVIADIYVLLPVLGGDQLSTAELCIAIGFCVLVTIVCVLNFMWFRKICRGAAKVINDK